MFARGSRDHPSHRLSQNRVHPEARKPTEQGRNQGSCNRQGGLEEAYASLRSKCTWRPSGPTHTSKDQDVCCYYFLPSSLSVCTSVFRAITFTGPGCVFTALQTHLGVRRAFASMGPQRFMFFLFDCLFVCLFFRARASIMASCALAVLELKKVLF